MSPASWIAFEQASDTHCGLAGHARRVGGAADRPGGDPKFVDTTHQGVAGPEPRFGTVTGGKLLEVLCGYAVAFDTYPKRSEIPAGRADAGVFEIN